MDKVQISATTRARARAFAEVNALKPNEWSYLGSAMALRARKDGPVYLVIGMPGAQEDELAIWAHFREGKVIKVRPLDRVNFGLHLP